jgi:hypothetical protein
MTWTPLAFPSFSRRTRPVIRVTEGAGSLSLTGVVTRFACLVAISGVVARSEEQKTGQMRSQSFLRRKIGERKLASGAAGQAERNI